MNKLITKIVGAALGLTMAVGVGVGFGVGVSKEAVPAYAAETEVLSWSRSSTTDTVTSGFYLSATASSKDGYYQDASSGTGYIMVQKGTSGNFSNMWTTAPTSISFTAKVGGGSANKDLSSPVYACLVDTDGNDIANTQITVTSHITTAAGDTYSNIAFTTKPSSASGVKIYHAKETGYNVRYYSYSLSYEAASGTSYSITTTGVVNGTVSGASTIAQNGNATITLVPNTGYKLPENSSSITVTNATLSSYDSTTGAVTLSNPTGAVTVSVTLPAATQYSISTSLTNLTASGASNVYENGTATVTLAVTDSDTYALPTNITVTNAVDYAYDSTTGEVTINGASGNVTITAAAIAKPAEAYEEFVYAADHSGWTEVTASEEYSKTVDLITVTWKKNTGSNIAYWNPARIYNNHSMTISATTGAGAVTTIKKVEITANSNTYATNTASSNVTKTATGGGSVASSTATNSLVTITLSGTVTQLTLTCGSTQVRWNSLKVTYEKDQSEVALQSISATCDGVLVSQQVTPTVTFTPASASNKVLHYAVTSGSQYATVDANTGLVTGTGAGTATITITPDDTNASATTVNVVVSALPAISTVTVGTRYAMVANLSSTDFELTGINTGGTYPYGSATNYDANPSNAFPVRVVNGLYAHTVALEVEIDSTTKYLSYDKNDVNNNLTAVTSIDRSACWIFAEEDSELVIRNVDVYGRKLAATTTTNNNVTTGRFACYQNLSATVITPTFVEIVESKTDKQYVQDFVDLYMHMSDYTDNKGWCSDGEHAYYLTAKAGYNELIYGNATRENLFQNDSDFAAAKARYEAWAGFNNDADPYDGYNTVHTPLQSAKILPSIIDGNTGTTVSIIVIISMVSLTAIGGYFFLKKRKEQ